MTPGGGVLRSEEEVHCGVRSHALKKAELQEGFGYIPNTGDHTNITSAFVLPNVNVVRLPDAHMESLQNSLPPDQWVAFFALLPASADVLDFLEDSQEAAAATLTKASRDVSFAYMPASKRPRLADLVRGCVGPGVNLAARLMGEGTVNKTDLFSEELEMASSGEWVEGNNDDEGPRPFAPMNGQWNQLVSRVTPCHKKLVVFGPPWCRPLPSRMVISRILMTKSSIFKDLLAGTQQFSTPTFQEWNCGLQLSAYVILSRKSSRMWSN